MEKWVSFEKMVPRKLIDKRVLDNGVTVYFYDKSRKVVGDRMEVRLLIEIPVRVRKEYFENLEDGEKAYRELNVRTTVCLEGFMDALSWVLEEKDIKSIEDYV